MAKTIKLMSANLLQVALDQYGDATGFVQILQANPDLADWFINQPVNTNMSAHALAGSQTLVLPPVSGISLNDLVYTPGLDNFSVVTSVTNNFETPGGLPFCQCQVAGEVSRSIPALGAWLSTTVTIAPALDHDLNVGSPVTFAVGSAKPLKLPPAPPASQNGVPI